MSSKPEFIVDNVVLPTPTADGFSVKENRIWSSNAGRNSSTGLFVGDVIAVKYTVRIVYERLDDAQMQLIRNVLSGADPWHSLQFPIDGATKKIICYCADPEYVMRRFDLKKKQAAYSGVTLEFIEQ